jgi:hypothetical protein
VWGASASGAKPAVVADDEVVVYRFDVYVIPRSSRPGPDGRHGGLARLRVSAPPEGGRANAEAVRVLSKALRSPVRIVAGAASRRKVVETRLDGADVQRALESLFGPACGAID